VIIIALITKAITFGRRCPAGTNLADASNRDGRAREVAQVPTPRVPRRYLVYLQSEPDAGSGTR
jgi:hypothetical protein